jgi:hypothetical protein
MWVSMSYIFKRWHIKSHVVGKLDTLNVCKYWQIKIIWRSHLDSYINPICRWWSPEEAGWIPSVAEIIFLSVFLTNCHQSMKSSTAHLESSTTVHKLYLSTCQHTIYVRICRSIHWLNQEVSQSINFCFLSPTWRLCIPRRCFILRPTNIRCIKGEVRSGRHLTWRPWIDGFIDRFICWTLLRRNRLLSNHTP